MIPVLPLLVVKADLLADGAVPAVALAMLSGRETVWRHAGQNQLLLGFART